MREIVRIVDKILSKEGPLADKVIGAIAARRDAATQAALRQEAAAALAARARNRNGLIFIALMCATAVGLVWLSFSHSKPDLAQQIVTAFFALFAGFTAGKRSGT